MQISSALVRLASEPEKKDLPSGKQVCEVRVRVIQGRMNEADGKEEWQDRGHWAKLNVWGKYAALLQKHFRKGDMLRVIDAVQANDPYPKNIGNTTVELPSFVLDTSIIAPHLPHIESMTYKPRQSDVQQDTQTDDEPPNEPVGEPATLEESVA